MTDNASPAFRYEDYRKLCATLARRAQSRLASRGMNFELEDLCQEAAIVFMRVAEPGRFKPDLGVKFSTYLGRAIMNELAPNRIGRNRCTFGHVALDDDGSEENLPLAERVGSDDEDPARIVEQASEASQRLQRLSPDARRVAKLLDEPPIEMVSELRRLKAMRELCRAGGFSAPVVKLDVTFVCELLGFGTARRSAVERSLKALMESLE